MPTRENRHAHEVRGFPAGRTNAAAVEAGVRAITPFGLLGGHFNLVLSCLGREGDQTTRTCPRNNLGGDAPQK